MDVSKKSTGNSLKLKTIFIILKKIIAHPVRSLSESHDNGWLNHNHGFVRLPVKRVQ